MAKPRIWPIILSAGLGIAMLCALGTWQVLRLAEKNKLLAEISSRANAEPISLAEVLKRQEADEDIEFLKVKTAGIFDHAKERQKLTAFDSAPGYEIITPLVSTEGIAVLVDRGVVPDELRDISKRPEPLAPVEVTAVVRTHDSAQGFFDPENDVEGNIWYWWDVPAMLSSVQISPELKVAPFILQSLPGAGPKKFPRAALAEVSLTNNHLQYAITWFSLAFVLLVIAGLFIRKQVNRTDP